MYEISHLQVIDLTILLKSELAGWLFLSIVKLSIIAKWNFSEISSKNKKK